MTAVRPPVLRPAGARERTVATRIAIAVARRVAVFLGVCAIIVLVWWLFLLVSGVSPFVAKSPLDVWEYLLTGPEAAENRVVVGEGLAITAHDASIGYIAGLGGAAIVAVLFALAPALATTFMPVAMVLRTFPLVALTPLIVLAFGRGDAGLAAIGFIVVFFAALVTFSFGIAGAPREALDVVTVFGGRRWARVWKVGVPFALPAFFTAARIAIPQALSAALIAEWLVTGAGSGAQLMRAAGSSQYAGLWATAVVLILSATIVYTLVSTLEELVLGRIRGGV